MLILKLLSKYFPKYFKCIFCAKFPLRFVFGRFFYYYFILAISASPSPFLGKCCLVYSGNPDTVSSTFAL